MSWLNASQVAFDYDLRVWKLRAQTKLIPAYVAKIHMTTLHEFTG